VTGIYRQRNWLLRGFYLLGHRFLSYSGAGKALIEGKVDGCSAGAISRWIMATGSVLFMIMIQLDTSLTRRYPISSKMLAKVRAQWLMHAPLLYLSIPNPEQGIPSTADIISFLISELPFSAIANLRDLLGALLRH